MLSVVIIEDSEWTRRGLVTLVPWEEHGFTMAGEASDGQKGFDLIRRVKPDVALVDIKMPVMDGLTMISHLKEAGHQGTEIIIISSYGDFAFTRQAILLGARDYLLKPIDQAEMLKMLHRIKLAIEAPELPARGLARIRELEGISPELRAFIDRLQTPSREPDPVVASLLRHMETRFNTDISLNDLVDELGMSESTLARRFKRVTGATFVEHLTVIRLGKALELLSDPTHRVSEVAAHIGIGDSRYFSEIFKRYTGYTPSEFRKLVHSER